MKAISGLLVPPHQLPCKFTLEPTLDHLQMLVAAGGYVEIIKPFTDGRLTVWLDEEGQYKNAPVNWHLKHILRETDWGTSDLRGFALITRDEGLNNHTGSLNEQDWMIFHRLCGPDFGGVNVAIWDEIFTDTP
jgi:hypothetical protein